MNLHEYQHLQAECTELQDLLDQIPKGNVIDRLSLESRKQALETILLEQTHPIPEPVHAKLTFRGQPVVESHGILAEFGSLCVHKFVNTVIALAASLSDSLGSRGILPNREDYQLLITGTATGSFGFHLEERSPKEPPCFDGFSTIESAFDKAFQLMEASQGSDEELTDVLAETDSRALNSMHDFLKTMADHEAMCTLEYKDRFFRYKNAGEVHQSLSRLSRDNIHENEAEFTGTFLGVLPKRRSFEFQMADSNQIISGKVGPTIADANIINQTLDQTSKIQVHSIQVGQGKPRYVLMSFQKKNE